MRLCFFKKRENKLKKAFTLAEVLITLAIIGVVAALTIPSVVANANQQEFKTGLRKAVSVLNSAITTNIALENETPYDNANLFGYFMRHMSIVKSYEKLGDHYYVLAPNTYAWLNSVFYTTDGMRFEFRRGEYQETRFTLYESGQLVCTLSTSGNSDFRGCGGCGSYGLAKNPDNTTKTPCLVVVDVNGDRKPNPSNAACKSLKCATPYKYSDVQGTRLTDMFTIMITEKEAIPYGVAAQRAMYGK